MTCPECAQPAEHHCSGWKRAGACPWGKCRPCRIVFDINGREMPWRADG